MKHPRLDLISDTGCGAVINLSHNCH